MKSDLVFDHHDAVAFLKEVFSEKSRANPKYSLRAFAAKTGLSPGALHKILGRQKRLSHERAYAVGKALGLEGDAIEYFVTLAELETTKSEDAKTLIRERMTRMNPHGIDRATTLSVDHFKLISDWYGLATLELVSAMKKTDGKPTGAWTVAEIAKALRIPIAQVSSTLERLLNLELIEKNSDGTYARLADSILVTANVPNDAIRNYYRGVIERCGESIATQTPAEKVTGAEVFAFDPSQLKKVRELTEIYLTGLRDLAETGKKRTEIYQAFTNVFRLTDKGVPS